MKKTRTSNSGFTLIELIIAMAILAFLMTAISGFMSSGVLSFKKAKADQAVNTSAQTVYDQMADTIMAANNVYVCGYVPTTEGDSIDFTESGSELGISVDGPFFFVKDEKEKNALLNNRSGITVEEANIKYFSEVKTPIYVKQLVIDKAVEIDGKVMSPSTGSVDGTYTNALTGASTRIRPMSTNVVIQENKDADGNVTSTITTYSGTATKSTLNNPTYTVNDTERNIFTFVGKNLYYEKQYAFMTALNDVSASGTKEKKNLYSKSFAYVKTPAGGGAVSDEISACILTVDTKGNALGIEFEFSDKNMTYKGEGMLNIRNSFVLRPKK